MRRAAVWPLATLALAACGISPSGTVQQTTRAGTGAPTSTSSPTAATSASAPAPNAVESSPTDQGATGKGQPAPSAQPTPNAGPTVTPAPAPTAPPTLVPLFNDNDVDNVNGGFVPAKSDGDGQG